MYRVGVLTVSDKGARGERADASGPAIREEVSRLGAEVVRYEVVPDDRPEIERRLAEWADSGEVDLILTTGGTGLSPRDVTPEATRAVVEREVPGLAEAMRQESRRVTPMAMLSRAVAGLRRRTLIVNLPGSPKGVRECLAVIAPALAHAVETARGSVGEHDRPA